MVGEFVRPMGAVDFLRRYAPHRFDELIEIRMIGKRQCVVDSQAVFRPLIYGPPGDGDGNRFSQAGQTKIARHHAAA